MIKFNKLIKFSQQQKQIKIIIKIKIFQNKKM